MMTPVGQSIVWCCLRKKITHDDIADANAAVYAGLNWFLHKFRHTFATRNLQDHVCDTGGASISYTQEVGTSSSISLNQTKTFKTTVSGPESDAAGVNHDYDVACLWLNPLLNFTVYSGFPYYSQVAESARNGRW